MATAINSVTLVGRNSAVTIVRFPSGAARANFTITVKRGEQVIDLPCEAWGKLAERAAEMEPGLLIGLIGSVTRDKAIRLDCLERLGPARAA